MVLSNRIMSKSQLSKWHDEIKLYKLNTVKDYLLLPMGEHVTSGGFCGSNCHVDVLLKIFSFNTPIIHLYCASRSRTDGKSIRCSSRQNFGTFSLIWWRLGGISKLWGRKWATFIPIIFSLTTKGGWKSSPSIPSLLRKTISNKSASPNSKMSSWVLLL